MPGELANRPLAVVAIGGNALARPETDAGGTPEEMWSAAHAAAGHLADLAAAGLRLVVTHGNGPQVGDELRRAELAAAEVASLTLDVAVAHTQGGIGYVLARTLGDALSARGLARPVAALVTQTVVDAGDPAFQHATKPIGPHLTAEHAQALAAARGWAVRPVEGGRWRRVVASPEPVDVLELAAIQCLLAGGAVVIAGGGGGVPVVRAGAGYEGIAAVVDKDLVSALIAQRLGADLLLIATDVEQVARDFGTPAARPIRQLTSGEAHLMLADGDFPAGSMGPKIAAALRFVDSGGGRAVITDIRHMMAAWRGEAGTELVAEGNT